MNARWIGGGASVLIHAAVLVALLPTSRAGGQPVAAVAPRSDEGDDFMRLVSSGPTSGDGLACANRYLGIGVATSFTGYVREVVAGGPADRAGLRVGDRFLNESIYFRDQYPLGKVLPLRIERDGRPLDLTVVIGSICYERITP